MLQENEGFSENYPAWRIWADLAIPLELHHRYREKKKEHVSKDTMGSTPNVGNRMGEVASPPDFFLSRMKCGSQNALSISHRTQISLPFGEGASWESKITQFRGYLSQLPGN